MALRHPRGSRSGTLLAGLQQEPTWLGALAEAAEVIQAPHASPEVMEMAPDAQSPAPEGPPGVPQPANATGQGEVWQAKMAAARSIEPGCDNHIIKQWEPKAAKPNKEHSLLALAERPLKEGERQAQADNWAIQQIANWLYKHAPAPAETGGDDQGHSPPVQQESDPKEGSDKPPPAPGSERWAPRSQGCRMVTLIARDDALRAGYLTKDAKFTTRGEKEVADRDSYWVNVAPVGAG